MKVILLQDVAKIGRRFDVADVPDGYALNLLIPKRMAEPATPANVKRVEARRAQMEAERAAKTDAVAHAVEALSGTAVELHAEANEQGHLFKGIRAVDVATRLSELGHNIPATGVMLAEEPIKEVGQYDVTLTAGEQTGTVSLNVVAKQ